MFFHSYEHDHTWQYLLYTFARVSEGCPSPLAPQMTPRQHKSFLRNSPGPDEQERSAMAASDDQLTKGSVQ